MDQLYYALTIRANRTSSAAYYALQPTSNLHVTEGSANIDPKTASATMVTVESRALQIQAPAGTVHGGVTIVTAEKRIDGEVMVSPPVDSEVEVILYGAGGKKLGTYVLAAGEGSGVFEFEVDAAEAIPPGDVAKVLKQVL